MTISTILILLFATLHLGRLNLVSKASHSPPSASLWLDWNNPAAPPDLSDPNRHRKLPKGLKRYEILGSFQVQQVSVYTRLGKIDLKTYMKAYGIKSSTNDEVPKDIVHAATILHGYAFEFIFDKGIYVTPAVQFVNETNPIWYDDVFQTKRTGREVKGWLKRNHHRYRIGMYEIVTNNCFTFIREFVGFLGGQEPLKYSKLRNWLRKNEEFGKLLQTALETKSLPAIPSNITYNQVKQ